MKVQLLIRPGWPDVALCPSHTILHCKKSYEIPGSFDQTFLGLGLGTFFPARESLVSDIPAGDGNIAKLFLQCSNLRLDKINR